MKHNHHTCTIHVLMLVLVAFAVASARAQLTMQPLASFGSHGDGSLRPGDIPYLTSDSQLQRGLAYNPATGHLLLVDRSTNSSSVNDVHIIDGNTGEYLGKLDNSSTLSGGTSGFTLNLIGVADDGAIYVCNLTSCTAGAPQTRLYRWNDETSPQNFVSPAPGFPADDPSNGNTNSTQKRWGDTMALRGSGLDTQILLANRGTLACIYTPDDTSYAHFTPHTLTTDVAAGALGYGLSFGAGDTFWGTSGAFGNGPLLHLSFDLNAGTATTITNIPSPRFPGVVSPFLVVPSSNLLAGISMVPGADVVRLYDISDPTAPVLLDRKNFVTSDDNNIFGGSVALGNNGILYALDSDNGIMAFALSNSVSNPLLPAFFLNPANRLVQGGTNASFTAGADGIEPPSYQWLFNGTNILNGATSPTLTLTNVQIVNQGNYSVIASNSSGSVTSSVAALTVAATPPSTLLGYEPFNYTSGQLLTAVSTNWTLNGTGNDSLIAPSGLSISGLASSSGSSVTNGGAGAGLRYAIGVSRVTGDVYYSFALRVDSLGTSFTSANGFIAAFVDPSGSSTYVARLSPRQTGTPGHYNLGISKVNSTIAWATNDIVEGQTIFVVARYTFNTTSTSDDQADLWIDPDSSAFGTGAAPTTSASAPQAGTDTSLISVFTFRQNTAANTPAAMTFDELRIGLTWADVTPPFVSTPSLGIISNGDGTVTLSWPTAAAGYNLEGASSLSSPAWSPVTNSIIFSGPNSTVTVNAGTGNQFFRLKK